MAAIGKYEQAAPTILKSIEDGHTNREAAQAAGINEDTFYEWFKTKPAFSEAVLRARKNGERNAIARVEASLLDLAVGFEYEEVATEYESRPNPDPQALEKYIPVIKKQKRTKKRVVQSIEAIRFYLSNKCPDVWKNRTDGNFNISDMMKDMKVQHVYDKDKRKEFAESEDDVEE